MCEKASGRSRGFGFITFETDAGMDAALAFKVRNIYCHFVCLPVKDDMIFTVTVDFVDRSISG